MCFRPKIWRIFNHFIFYTSCHGSRWLVYFAEKNATALMCKTLIVSGGWVCIGSVVAERLKITEFKLLCFWQAECGFQSPVVKLVSLYARHFTIASFLGWEVKPLVPCVVCCPKSIPYIFRIAPFTRYKVTRVQRLFDQSSHMFLSSLCHCYVAL